MLHPMLWLRVNIACFLLEVVCGSFFSTLMFFSASPNTNSPSAAISPGGLHKMMTRAVRVMQQLLVRVDRLSKTYQVQGQGVPPRMIMMPDTQKLYGPNASQEEIASGTILLANGNLLDFSPLQQINKNLFLSAAGWSLSGSTACTFQGWRDPPPNKVLLV